MSNREALVAVFIAFLTGVIAAGSLGRDEATLAAEGATEAASQHPMLLLFYRCLLMAMITLPFSVYHSAAQFPSHKKWLLLTRGFLGFAGIFGGMYGARHLPLGDARMLGSVSPLTTSLLAKLFLSEPFGLFEAGNLLLIVAGIVLVMQPTLVFGSGGREFTSMEVTASAVVLVTSLLAGGITVVLRWAEIFLLNNFPYFFYMRRKLRDLPALSLIMSNMWQVSLLTLIGSIILGVFCLIPCGEGRYTMGMIALGTKQIEV